MRELAILSRRALAALPIAAFAGTSAAAPAALPLPAGTAGDAELLDLGRRWLALHVAHVEHWHAWQALPEAESALRHDALQAECEAMSYAEWGLEASIRAIPATTIAGLAVKARILAHEHDVEVLDEASVARALQGASYADDRAALSLVLDVLRLARATS